MKKEQGKIYQEYLQQSKSNRERNNVMSLRDAYKKKAEAELELAQAKLVEFKAKVKSMTADARVKYSSQVEDLEKGVEAAKDKLKELGNAGEEVWEKFKDGVESALRSLSKAINDIANKFD
jgi:phosphoenolpyruvate carboxylase